MLRRTRPDTTLGREPSASTVVEIGDARRRGAGSSPHVRRSAVDAGLDAAIELATHELDAVIVRGYGGARSLHRVASAADDLLDACG